RPCKGVAGACPKRGLNYNCGDRITVTVHLIVARPFKPVGLLPIKCTVTVIPGVEIVDPWALG
ncbi:MAG TPA: hypothetical protein VG960_02485, partial [Caulobacteraceae bacterium]|nr:hypothetical protein [Caulobacteraceae bacterium]